MDQFVKRCLKACAAVTALLLVCALAFAFVAGEDWTKERVSYTDHVSPAHDVGNLFDAGHNVEQSFTPNCAILDSVTIWPVFPGQPAGELKMELYQNGELLGEGIADISQMANYVPYAFTGLELSIEKGQPVLARISANTEQDGEYFSLLYGSTMTVGGKYEVEANDIDGLVIGDVQTKGKLVMDSEGLLVHEKVMAVFWAVAALAIVAVDIYVVRLLYLRKEGKSNVVLRIVDEVRQYSYLISRLVSRNFNTKYRQSALGVLWSVLNPVFTMLVLYIVFSTLFQNNTENYIVYLFSGIVAWNFFTEAVSLGLESITGNASIINKVYVPRYIYPISNVISALINFLFAHIPLILLCLFTGIRITKAYLMLPLAIGLLFIFACGVAMLMATSNVFFRDTRFLWSIVSMMWMYLTPTFYTESIIPEAYISLYRCNPLYQFITVFRSLLIQGVVPQPEMLITASLMAVVTLALGIWTFSRNQNRFVLYL